MIKKCNSLLLMVAIVFGTMFTANAQDNTPSDSMLESIMLTPDNTKLKVLGENMRKHNQKYHKEGAYKSTVYAISTGPNVGKIVWMMGPLKYTHLDSRPAEGGHDDDWRDNIMPYIKKMNAAEYWKQDIERSNTSMLDGDASKYPVLRVRYFEVTPGHGYTVNRLFSQVKATLESIEGEYPWGVYDNEFLQGDLGRHIAAVSFMKNWAEFDEDIKFVEAFEKLYGNNSYNTFTNMRNDTFSNRWDEIWVYDKNMSGD
jgi:hypothetical protein